MYLDYSKLAFDKNGTPETPTLVLKTMHEETIGVIPGVYNLNLANLSGSIAVIEEVAAMLSDASIEKASAADGEKKK